MNDYQSFSFYLPQQVIDEALRQAQSFDRNNTPLEIVKALDDLASIGERIYKAEKLLGNNYFLLGMGLALQKYQNCKQEDQKKQRGTWL